MNRLIRVLKRLRAAAAPKPRARRPARPCAPRLESLDDRRLLTAFLVTTPYDSGPGSLRAAILGVNADPITSANPLDTISFRPPLVAPVQTTNPLSPGLAPLPGTSSPGFWQVIRPTSPLPVVTRPVVIDGTIQLGIFGGTSTVTLDGGLAGSNADGLRIQGSNISVRDLSIRGFSGDGILVDHAYGVGIGADVISNNGGNGIEIRNSQPPLEDDAFKTNIFGTEIGFNANGILIDNSSWVAVGLGGNPGPALQAHDNRILANRGNGIEIRGQNAKDVTVKANLIESNQGFGVLVNGPSRNLNITIGDNLPKVLNSGNGNRISVNGRGGISVASGFNVNIWDNSISLNNGAGISLGAPASGSTPATFGNASVPAPVITSASNSRGTISWHITGGPPNSFVQVQFFQNGAAGQNGATVIGYSWVNTDGNGNASKTDNALDLNLRGPLTSGTFITATATYTALTGPLGTSPFSGGQAVGP